MVAFHWGCHLTAWIPLGMWLRHLLLSPVPSCTSLSTFPGHVETTFTLLTLPEWHMTCLHHTSWQSMALLILWFFLIVGIGPALWSEYYVFTATFSGPCQPPCHLGLTPAQPRVPCGHQSPRPQPLGPAQGKPSKKEHNHQCSRTEAGWQPL